MMRRSLWTLTLFALATSLEGCLAQSGRSPGYASDQMLRAPSDSVVVAYEAGRRAAMKAQRGRTTEVVGWLAAPTGFLAGHVAHAGWVQAVTAIAISGSTLVTAYHQRSQPALQAPDSMRTALGSDRMWDAYRRGFQYEVESKRSTELTRASLSTGGTILSYGIAPLISRPGNRP